MLSNYEFNRQQMNQGKPEHPIDLVAATEQTLKISNPIHRAIKLGLGYGILMAFLILAGASIFREWGLSLLPVKSYFYQARPESTVDELKQKLQRSRKTVVSLQRKVDRLTPLEPYLIIDTSENLIFLKKGKKLLHQGICSTGSYIMLKTADGSEKWIFKTPRGMLRIQAKIEDPVWRMPDWAFIEDGLPVPDPYSHERYETGVLGDYALSLGDGYLIHGTLYQRFLGLPVTHGCVRLGDKELEVVFRTLRVGSKVFIY